MLALCYCSINCRVMLLLEYQGICILGVVTSWLVQWEHRALRIYIFALRGEEYTQHRVSFLVDFPVFCLPY